jgi:transcriptional regulator with XRE-family HTH domain
MTGHQLRAIRERLGLTQPALGRALGALLSPPRAIPAETISRWECGHRGVPGWVGPLLDLIEVEMTRVS